MNIINKIVSYIRKLKFKKNCKLCFGKAVTISRGCIFKGANYLENGTNIRNSSFGYATYVGEDSFVHNSIIGKYTCIGPRVRTVFGTHPTSKFVSIHPAFFSLRKQAGFTYVTKQKFKEFMPAMFDGYSIKIGNDVWIGSNVLILDGVDIGDGAIIAAGSVVTKNVPSYAIIGGVPAKLIRYRFTNSDIQFLNKLKWWNKDENWIKNHAELFEDIKLLREKVEEENDK